MTGYDSMFRLDRHVAVVTGASRNIGAAIAEAFAAAGADLLLVARTESELTGCRAVKSFGRA